MSKDFVQSDACESFVQETVEIQVLSILVDC